MLIKGKDLTSNQRMQVLRVFVYRWTKENRNLKYCYKCPHCGPIDYSEGNGPYQSHPNCTQFHPTIPLISDEQWITEHAFHFSKSGVLQNKPAEPHYLAE